MRADRDLDQDFQDLYKQYYRAVVLLFFRRGFSREDARELAQDTFVRVYQGMNKSYRGEARWGYIRKTAEHVGANTIRGQKVHKRRAEILSLNIVEHLPHGTHLDPTTQQPRASPLQEVLEREERQLLREALKALDPEDQLLVLLWLQGLTYKEIEIAMQVSMDTVKTRLSRLKKRLQESLRKKLPPSAQR